MGYRVESLSWQIAGAAMSVRVSSEQVGLVHQRAISADARALLLTEVDFKWLMAGQGWWVNAQRFHADPRYAADLLRLGLISPCATLRACALTLQGHTVDLDVGDLA